MPTCREDIVYLGNEDDKPFAVEITGISYCDSNYHIDRENSPVSVIEYIVSGRGTLVINGETYYPEAGDVYFLPAGSNHGYESSKDEPWVKVFANLKGNLATELMSAYGIGGKYLFKNVPAEELFRKFYDTALSEGIAGGDRLIEKLSLIFHEIVIFLANCQSKREEKSDITFVKEYIDRHIYDKISIDDAARSIYRSKDYVIKGFSAAYGKTPYEYAISRKLEVARNMLAFTRLSISEISERLGFSDQHYFSNLFRKRCGTTPSAYRKSGRLT